MWYEGLFDVSSLLEGVMEIAGVVLIALVVIWVIRKVLCRMGGLS